MAYSDYGGYAYRNGLRVVERSDAVLSPEGVKATPGQWPGWTIPEGRNGGSYHALLGDGPIFVGLYKQSTVTVFRLGEELDVADLLQDPEEGSISSYEHDSKKVRYINTDHYIAKGEPYMLLVDGWRIEVQPTIEDNHYVYARVTQPDGVVWHGFSGYGVGSGLEDAEYGFSTAEREITLFAQFPYAAGSGA